MIESEYRKGDLVEAVKGDTVIRGRLVLSKYECNTGEKGLYIEALGNLPFVNTDAAGRQGWAFRLIERATPPLPTEPGAVVRIGNEGDRRHWLLWLAGDGDWDGIEPRGNSFRAIGDPLAWIREQGETIGKVVPLEPVPVTNARILPSLKEVARCIARPWDSAGSTVSTTDIRKGRRILTDLITELGVEP